MIIIIGGNVIRFVDGSSYELKELSPDPPAPCTPRAGRVCVSGNAAQLVAAARAHGLRAALAAVGMARAAGRRVDSHLHLWTPEEAFPADPPPPAHLNDGRATHENFVKLMDENGVQKAVVVQPINYGQDYSYLLAAMAKHPERLLGVFVADPTAADASWMDKIVKTHKNWVGVRFNPYKWSGTMADDVGKALFRRAGELKLPVGFMPFKGLSQHVADIEALMEHSPETQVIIDHWGFFLQPATGFGERSLDEESWQALLKLQKYPQVHVKISALFRVSSEGLPFSSLSERLKELLGSFGASRLLWGSDFPYCSEHGTYGDHVQALESWPVWQDMSEADKHRLLYGTAAELYGRIDMCGWQTVAARSSPEVIVWSLESDPATTCNWLLEEDVDQNTLEGLDSRNIIQGKRRRAKVDYAALERQIDQEQKKTQDVFSDRSSDSGEGEGESLEMSPKEWAEHHAKQSAKAAGEFRKWMLSTCTSRHEELLRRKGLLVTRMPVALVGPGRRTLEKELAPYGVKLRFHCQETVVLVDASCRERFQAKHPQEWRDAREAKESPTTAAPVASPPALAAPAAPAAPAATSASQAVSPAKKRRLRRIVTDSDDEAPEAEAPSTEAPQSTSEGQVPDLQAAWSEVEEKSGVVPRGQSEGIATSGKSGGPPGEGANRGAASSDL
ncbi:unnamed protein product [Effrenium voratum]|nr:unnamed protein product [Effrenium voratum]